MGLTIEIVNAGDKLVMFYHENYYFTNQILINLNN